MQRKIRKRSDASDETPGVEGGGVSLKALFGRLFANAKSRKMPIGDNGKSRAYPQLTTITAKATIPVSFVVIRFSDEYHHNFLKSECAHDALNEVIEVDNTSNLYFDNLSQAIIAGLSKAQNDIVAVIHEDVLLPEGWQSQFEQSLHQLEEHDPSWGMLGSVGWDANGEFIGHWSDPHQFKNTFKDSQYDFQEAGKLDEQLLIFNRHREPNLDSNLPGIHFLGEDLKHKFSRIGLRCYAINAPTIHKYADKNGVRIVSSSQSDKITDRESATYLADEACCKDYVRWKHPNQFPFTDRVTPPVPLDARKNMQLERPVIFVCKGELESLLIRRMVQEAGVFVVGEPSEPGEASELLLPIYKMVIEKFRCHALWQKGNTAGTLQSCAAQMINALPLEQPWGFIFPESILILPELGKVFPKARYVYFQRDPLDICKRETHRTARLENHIGRIALPEAYSFLGMERAQILDDDELDHMVYTTIHQLELVNQHLATVANSELLILRFEDLRNSPTQTMQHFCLWLDGRDLSKAIKIEEPGIERNEKYSPARIMVAAEKLSDAREALGYTR